jgi:transposase
MVDQTAEERRMSNTRKYRQCSVEQKLEIVLVGLRGERSVRDVCLRHEISETLYFQWCDKVLESGKQGLARLKSEDVKFAELRKRVALLERTLGKKTYELEVAGDYRGGWM